MSVKKFLDILRKLKRTKRESIMAENYDYLKRLLEDLRKLNKYKEPIRWGHYGKERLQEALDLLILEIDYLTIFE